MTWAFDLINLEEFNKFLKWKQKKNQGNSQTKAEIKEATILDFSKGNLHARSLLQRPIYALETEHIQLLVPI